VTIEGFDAGEKLAVVPARDQDLGARAYSGLEDGQRPGGELVLFNLRDLILPGTELANTASCVVEHRYVRQLVAGL
jgi:hypothetical protein